MILTSHQPNFIPYMGVFYKAFKSDILVLSDDVQFSKKGMHNWNLIRAKSGEQRITIPVKAHDEPKIYEVLIHDPCRSLPKAGKTLREVYAKTPHYEEGLEIVRIIEGMAEEGLHMADLNIAIIKHVLDRMGIGVKTFRGKEDLNLFGHKDDRILMMCAKTGADVYYSGVGAKVYHEEDRYTENRIKLVYSDYHPVVYRQKYEPFIPNMSCVDYVFNEGYKIPESWNE